MGLKLKYSQQRRQMDNHYTTAALDRRTSLGRMLVLSPPTACYTVQCTWPKVRKRVQFFVCWSGLVIRGLSLNNLSQIQTIKNPAKYTQSIPVDCSLVGCVLQQQQHNVQNDQGSFSFKSFLTKMSKYFYLRYFEKIA